MYLKFIQSHVQRNAWLWYSEQAESTVYQDMRISYMLRHTLAPSDTWDSTGQMTSRQVHIGPSSWHVCRAGAPCWASGTECLHPTLNLYSDIKHQHQHLPTHLTLHQISCTVWQSRPARTILTLARTLQDQPGPPDTSEDSPRSASQDLLTLARTPLDQPGPSWH